MTNSTEQFYASLPVHHHPLQELLLRQDLFKALPADWCVIVTDIRKSTDAVKSGLHENVNLVATGSIVCLLNLAFRDKVEIPFFFGGDGATFIVPPALLKKAIPALLVFKERTLTDFSFDLRIGYVPVSDIYTKGHRLHICRFSASDMFPIPIIGGNGLQYAESIIKGADYLLSEDAVDEAALDLNGMQCRWDRIPPPENKEEVVTLLVTSRNQQEQNIVFSEIMRVLDEVYGSPVKRQPISVSRLKLKTTFSRLGNEVKSRLGKIKYLRVIYLWFMCQLGKFYFRTRKGKEYLDRLVAMSDTLVMDGRINTVISGTTKQRNLLLDALDKMESDGKIYYGFHISNSSIMSCYVRDMKDGHIHFVDGAEGGYTQAATMLKEKIRR